MAWPKGKPRPKGAGRKKGTQNKIPIAAKEAMLAAFAGVGGVEMLITWAKSENPRKGLTEFFKLWSKTLPRDLNVSGTLGLMRPDMSYLTDAELAEIDAIHDRAEKRAAQPPTDQSGTSGPVPG